MKKLVATLAGIVMAMTALTFAPAAQAATVKCTPTKAKGITPKKIATPKKVLTKFPKKFTLVTNCGNIVISSVGAKAPFTMTSIAALAKGGFYNNTLCHRLTTQGLFVLQCGDPTATGSGGPQFTYPDENLPANKKNNYPAGTVAMANSGPNTNGSQFFLVYANTTLAPSYTIWGTITSGLDIVKAIAKAGAVGGAPDGKPAKTIAIQKVLVS
jgi:peptidyl-prolyl cis-trans isomerase B (cyclophilin B)|uniref:peptidylprolyl isomerase n=1 Tax=Candidatus Planktophila sp. TaxID=2175601 RepID=UPI00404AB7BC